MFLLILWVLFLQRINAVQNWVLVPQGGKLFKLVPCNEDRNQEKKCENQRIERDRGAQHKNRGECTDTLRSQRHKNTKKHESRERAREYKKAHRREKLSCDAVHETFDQCPKKNVIKRSGKISNTGKRCQKVVDINIRYQKIQYGKKGAGASKRFDGLQDLFESKPENLYVEKMPDDWCDQTTQDNLCETKQPCEAKQMENDPCAAKRSAKWAARGSNKEPTKEQKNLYMASNACGAKKKPKIYPSKKHSQGIKKCFQGIFRKKRHQEVSAPKIFILGPKDIAPHKKPCPKKCVSRSIYKCPKFFVGLYIGGVRQIKCMSKDDMRYHFCPWRAAQMIGEKDQGLFDEMRRNGKIVDALTPPPPPQAMRPKLVENLPDVIGSDEVSLKGQNITLGLGIGKFFNINGNFNLYSDVGYTYSPIEGFYQSEKSITGTLADQPLLKLMYDTSPWSTKGLFPIIFGMQRTYSLKRPHVFHGGISLNYKKCNAFQPYLGVEGLLGKFKASAAIFVGSTLDRDASIDQSFWRLGVAPKIGFRYKLSKKSSLNFSVSHQFFKSIKQERTIRLRQDSPEATGANSVKSTIRHKPRYWDIKLGYEVAL